MSAETTDTTIARVNAAFDLLMEQCQHCHINKKIIALNGALPGAVSIEHEPGCPDFVE